MGLFLSGSPLLRAGCRNDFKEAAQWDCRLVGTFGEVVKEPFVMNMR
jgi:hypothetical protein